LGCFAAAIGFNVMHDGAHGSFSRYKWINNLASNFANFLGASQHMWKTKHNVIHHTYTNIHGVDDDIEARPLLRLCDEQPHYKIHKYQHFYFWAAYSLLYIYWVFVTDYTKYFSGKIGSIALRKMIFEGTFSFGSTKLLMPCFCGHTYLYGWVYTLDHWVPEYGHGYRICFEHSIPVSPYSGAYTFSIT
jgi:linoleoyl-CoA desaturase